MGLIKCRLLGYIIDMSERSAWSHAFKPFIGPGNGVLAYLALTLGLSACTDLPPPAPLAGTASNAAAQVSGLSLYPENATLSVPPENPGLASAGFQTSLQLDARGAARTLSPEDLVWHSSHPELVQVDAMGLVSAARTTGGAKPTVVPVTITATLRQDSTKVATTAVSITDEGTLILQPQGGPLSANSAIFSLYYADGMPMVERTFSSLGALLSEQAFFRMRAALGIKVVGKFYRETTPTGASTPIAMGVATVNTYANNLNIHPLPVSAVTQPTLAVASPNYGGVGKVVTLSGANFGHADSLDYSVKFAGVSAVANRTSDQLITATVPAGAVNGDLDLFIDGIKTTLQFKLVTALSFRNPLWSFQSSRQFAVEATFSDKSTSSVSAVTWSSSNPSVAVVDQNGLVRDVAPGVTTIRATSGQAAAEATITVYTVGGILLASVTIPNQGPASVSVPVTMPSAAPGNLGLISSP